MPRTPDRAQMNGRMGKAMANPQALLASQPPSDARSTAAGEDRNTVLEIDEYIRTRNKAILVIWGIVGVCVVGLGLVALSIAVNFFGLEIP